MKNKIIQLINEIENWNAGDRETFDKYGEVPFDGRFVFQARQAKINKLRGLIKKIEKKS